MVTARERLAGKQLKRGPSRLGGVGALAEKRATRIATKNIVAKQETLKRNIQNLENDIEKTDNQIQSLLKDKIAIENKYINVASNYNRQVNIYVDEKTRALGFSRQGMTSQEIKDRIASIEAEYERKMKPHKDPLDKVTAERKQIDSKITTLTKKLYSDIDNVYKLSGMDTKEADQLKKDYSKSITSAVSSGTEWQRQREELVDREVMQKTLEAKRREVGTPPKGLLASEYKTELEEWYQTGVDPRKVVGQKILAGGRQEKIYEKKKSIRETVAAMKDEDLVGALAQGGAWAFQARQQYSQRGLEQPVIESYDKKTGEIKFYLQSEVEKAEKIADKRKEIEQAFGEAAIKQTFGEDALEKTGYVYNVEEQPDGTTKISRRYDPEEYSYRVLLQKISKKEFDTSFDKLSSENRKLVEAKARESVMKTREITKDKLKTAISEFERMTTPDEFWFAGPVGKYVGLRLTQPKEEAERLFFAERYSGLAERQYEMKYQKPSVAFEKTMLTGETALLLPGSIEGAISKIPRLGKGISAASKYSKFAGGLEVALGAGMTGLGAYQVKTGFEAAQAGRAEEAGGIGTGAVLAAFGLTTLAGAAKPRTPKVELKTGQKFKLRKLTETEQELLRRQAVRRAFEKSRPVKYKVKYQAGTYRKFDVGLKRTTLKEQPFLAFEREQFFRPKYEPVEKTTFAQFTQETKFMEGAPKQLVPEIRSQKEFITRKVAFKETPEGFKVTKVGEEPYKITVATKRPKIGETFEVRSPTELHSKVSFPEKTNVKIAEGFKGMKFRQAAFESYARSTGRPFIAEELELFTKPPKVDDFGITIPAKKVKPKPLEFPEEPVKFVKSEFSDIDISGFKSAGKLKVKPKQQFVTNIEKLIKEGEKQAAPIIIESEVQQLMLAPPQGISTPAQELTFLPTEVTAIRQEFPTRATDFNVVSAKEISKVTYERPSATLIKQYQSLKPDIKLRSAPKFDLESKTKLDTKTKSTSKQKSMLKLEPMSSSIQKTSPLQKLKIETLPATKMQVKTQPKSKVKQRITRVPKTVPIIPTAPVFFGPSQKKQQEQLDFGLESFKVFVKRRGKWQLIGEDLTKGEAIALGKTRVKEGLGATFTIQEEKDKLIKREPTISLASAEALYDTEFRQFKIKSGKRVPLKDTFIQMKQFRLGTKKERKEIQEERKLSFGVKLKKTKGGWF